MEDRPVSNWVNIEHWTSHRGTTLVMRNNTLLAECDILPESLLAALTRQRREPALNPDELVRHVIGVAVAKGWLPDGSQPIAFWCDYARNCFLLSVTHMDLPVCREGDRFPEVIV